MEELLSQARYHAEAADAYYEKGNIARGDYHSRKWQRIWYRISLLEGTVPYGIWEGV